MSEHKYHVGQRVASLRSDTVAEQGEIVAVKGGQAPYVVVIDKGGWHLHPSRYQENELEPVTALWERQAEPPGPVTVVNVNAGDIPEADVAKAVAAEIRSAGAALVHGEREGSYGDPTVNFTRIAGMWSALIGADIKPRDVALMMVLLKVSREYGSHKPDNLDDIEGYVECSRLIEKGNNQ